MGHWGCAARTNRHPRMRVQDPHANTNPNPKPPPSRLLVAETLGRRSVGAEPTLDRRREAVEDFTFGVNFPGEGTDGEQSAVVAPLRRLCRCSVDARSALRCGRKLAPKARRLTANTRQKNKQRGAEKREASPERVKLRISAHGGEQGPGWIRLC